MAPLLEPPSLATWLQQLAGILPLTALIEFIDPPTILHTFELSGCVPLWAWPVTPAGARLLFAPEDSADACCLDHVERSTVLHCIDGRHGDWYPCSTPTTTRLCVSSHGDPIKVANTSENLGADRTRRQKLQVVLLTPIETLKGAAKSGRNAALRPEQHEWARTLLARSWRYKAVAVVGWVLWVGTVVVCFLAGLYVAAVYLLLVTLTGITIRFTHGGLPRQLVDSWESSYQRMVVVTSSLNGSDWMAFYGGSHVVNSLLNKPLYRRGDGRLPVFFAVLQRVFIAGQWVLAVGSCALQDWNAFVITIWLGLCAAISAYAYPPNRSIQDWLRYDCGLKLERITVEFSTRRAMLSALVCINPDRVDPAITGTDPKERHTNWINPILTESSDRRSWESALLYYLKDPSYNEENSRDAYWWKFIQEGVDVGNSILEIIKMKRKSVLKNLVPPQK